MSPATASKTGSASPQPTAVLRHHPLLPWLDTQTDSDPQQMANLRCTYHDPNGQSRYCRISARSILFDGRLAGFRGTASDITDEVAAHARIQHLSMHDALTGLANRNKLSRHLEQALLRGNDSPPRACCCSTWTVSN
jgi:predicted signal transduction protein with EAL and GGDEF domain